MYFRLLAAAAALTVPAIAAAQVAPASRTTSVEVVATGTIDAPASWFTVGLTYSVQADDKEAAEKAHLEKQQAIRAAAQKAGVPLASVTMTAGSETTTTTTPEIFDTPVEAMDADPDAKDSKDNKDDKEAEAVIPEPKPMTVISDTATVKASSLEQARALTEALEAIDVQAGKPVAVLADPEGVHRQAKAKALSVARSDAEAYGRELGLRPVRVARISEVGNQAMFPGLQEKFREAIDTAMYSGPQALQSMFQNQNTGTVHVEETIIVEFVMAP
jgi:uncharacterized protein YggE